jgi:hypothetical protein
MSAGSQMPSLRALANSLIGTLSKFSPLADVVW